MKNKHRPYIAVVLFFLSACATIATTVLYMFYDNKYWNPEYPSRSFHTPIRITADAGLVMLFWNYIVNFMRAMKEDKPSKIDLCHCYFMLFLISMVGFYDPVSDDVFTAVFDKRHISTANSTGEPVTGIYDKSVEDGRICVALTIVSPCLGLLGFLAALVWSPKKISHSAQDTSTSNTESNSDVLSLSLDKDLNDLLARYQRLTNESAKFHNAVTGSCAEFDSLD